ncbi:unnamed protein product [Caenorhabditis bovis]|uniref:Uncharacterized protein n=1 Tax=Caenorhabditis bovis TaxID=2654633 RepID=A0A8S1ESQ9_9PELO|nr:unnamed protein product [Caenorhabditis bovis]
MRLFIVIFCVIAAVFSRPGGYGRPYGVGDMGPPMDFQQGGFPSQQFSSGGYGAPIGGGGYAGGAYFPFDVHFNLKTVFAPSLKTAPFLISALSPPYP